MVRAIEGVLVTASNTDSAALLDGNQVGILHHDDRVIAAQFQPDALDRVGHGQCRHGAVGTSAAADSTNSGGATTTKSRTSG